MWDLLRWGMEALRSQVLQTERRPSKNWAENPVLGNLYWNLEAEPEWSVFPQETVRSRWVEML